MTLIVVRALHFWAVATMFGGGGFLLLSRRDKPVPQASATLRIGALGAAVTGFVWLAFTFVGVTDDPFGLWRPDLWAAFFMTPFGLPWATRVVLLAGCLPLAVGRGPSPFVVVGACLVLDQAWLGHAATGAGISGVAVLVSYAVHVLAGFGWVGALTMLCVTFRATNEAARLRGLRLFATLGPGLVAAILASGCVNAAFRIAALDDLVATPYGRLVGVKLLLFAAMLGLAVGNRREARAQRPRTGLILVETALGALVLGVAAALGITEPPP